MCKNISVSSGIILGLILMCVFSLYMYQFNEKNIITNAQREKLKYEDIEKDVVDYIYYRLKCQ